MCKKYFICTVLAAAGFCSALWAAERENKLFSYASHNADAILYFSTRQPESAMDEQLWQQIQNDKKKAIQADPDGMLFDVENRDMEAIVNLYINSLTPLSATVEGAANITGNIKADIQKMLGAIAEDNGPVPQISNSDDLSMYNFSFPANGTLPPMDVMFVQTENNLVQFRINVTPKGKMPQSVLSTNQGGKVPLLAKVPSGDQAFILAVKTAKFANAPALQQNPKTQLLSLYLNQMGSICIYGRVQQRHLLITAAFIFKQAADANAFAMLLENFKTQLPSQDPKELPKISVRENLVQVNANVDIASSWQIISRITLAQPGAAAVEQDENDDDDDTVTVDTDTEKIIK